MLLSLVQTVSKSPFQSRAQTHLNPILNPSSLLSKSLFPCFDSDGSTNSLKRLLLFTKKSYNNSRTNKFKTNAVITASLLEAPVIWAGRVCIFYALLKAGLAGSKTNPLVQGIYSCVSFIKSAIFLSFEGY